MKWINHQILTGFIVYAATDNALSVASSIFGAVIPDRVEGSPPKDNAGYWAWRRRHRTWSHYPMIYLALIGLSLFAKDYCQSLNASYLPTLLTLLDVFMFAMIGALLHIVEDGICGKVPIFTPHSKHGLKLFTVGSWKEYFFSAIIILICLASRLDNLDEIINIISTNVTNR
ncbi:MAG: metal-dependent hydrolase [Selenomonadaceae bacterium]|nr:metal-dependent hydrolase [Selenomonadaceae bacterium]